jgi:hypothetical protein
MTPERSVTGAIIRVKLLLSKMSDYRYHWFEKNGMLDGKTGFWTPNPVRSDHVQP